MKTIILNRLVGMWNSLPVILRAVLSGFLVSSAGIFVWSVFMAVLPAPWYIVPMIPALWLFCKCFSGGFFKNKPVNIFQERFRLTRLQPQVWKWGIMAALLFVVIIQFSFVVTFRLVDFPAAKFVADYKMVDHLPLWQAFAIITMGSVVAAIAEETGFRGFMQQPIENKYGPVAGIIITSAVFTAIHLSHTWARPIWPHIFFASVLLGILAYRTGSLIPGIIGHAILDVFDYSIWWTDLTGGFKKQPIFKTGIDPHFVFSVLILAVGLFGFFIAMKRLKGRRAEAGAAMPVVV